MKHTCHARQCNTPVPPKMFACKKHWNMLSKELQKKLWNVYVPGQEVRKDATREYIKVQKECVEYIASIEFKDERIKIANEMKVYLERYFTPKQIAFWAGKELEDRGLRPIYQQINSKLGYVDYAYNEQTFLPIVRMRFVTPLMYSNILDSLWNEEINIIYSIDGLKWKVSKTGKLENCLRWLQKVS